jgi:hypothetical protein
VSFENSIKDRNDGKYWSWQLRLATVSLIIVLLALSTRKKKQRVFSSAIFMGNHSGFFGQAAVKWILFADFFKSSAFILLQNIITGFDIYICFALWDDFLSNVLSKGKLAIIICNEIRS